MTNIRRALQAAAGIPDEPPGPGYQVWTWGSGGNGIGGHDNTTNYSSPVQVGVLTNWGTTQPTVSMAFHVLAIKGDGTLWAWGQGSDGRLGLNNTTSYSSPVQVGSLTNWAFVARGSQHTLAVKTDGTFWSWGNGGSGRLALGNTTAYSSPKQVGSLTNWAKVATKGNSSAAIKTDGTLWTWGRGSNGRLGHGDTTSLSSPVQVGGGTDWATNEAGFDASFGIIGRS